MSVASLILASASTSRARLLTAAGLAFDALPADVDEDAVKRASRAKGETTAHCARSLAEMKAARISAAHPDALVIGADQMLDAEGRWFDKPRDLAAAREQLLFLAGKTHTLPTAAVVVRAGRCVWHHVASPRLTMRPFGAGFVDDYLARVGSKALSSVGAYQLEGLGVQLFAEIDGDFFTILGLPLLPLLAFLREHGVIGA